MPCVRCASQRDPGVLAVSEPWSLLLLMMSGHIKPEFRISWYNHKGQQGFTAIDFNLSLEVGSFCAIPKVSEGHLYFEEFPHTGMVI